jgi:hypothetical protein
MHKNWDGFVKRFLYLFLASALTVVFFHYGQEVAFSTQWPLYDSLRNTSAIIFGVMGAWIALIYPEALSSLLKTNQKNSADRKRLNEVHKILHALVLSSCILSMVLMVGFLAPIAKQIPWLITNTKWVRGASYSLLGLLTICQLWTVVLTLLPADRVKRNIDGASKKKQIRNAIASQTDLSHSEELLDETDD